MDVLGDEWPQPERCLKAEIMRYYGLSTLVFLMLFAAPMAAADEPPAAAAAPLVLEMTLDYVGSELRQAILVAEGRDFRVVTHSGGVRWTIEGHIGRIVNGVAPITLGFGAYDSPTSNIGGLPSPLELTVDDCGKGGWGDPHLMVNSLWLRRGIDPIPVLTRSIAARRKDYAIAICRLGEFGPKAKPAVAELIGVLKDAAIDRERKPYNTIRAAAADALGKIGPAASDAVPALLRTIHDENPFLRIDAALALWKIAAHPDAASVAIKEFGNDSRSVRYRAAGAIRQIGRQAKAAVPALTSALADADAYVRIEAALALWGINHDPAALACLIDISEHDADAEIRRYAASICRSIEDEQEAEQ